MKIDDVKKIPYLISECGEDLSKLKELKYDLMDDEIDYKDQLTGLERDDYGICLDNKSFRTIKTNLQYIQRYLLQVTDIIKDINTQNNLGASKDKLILLSKMKDEREEAKRKAYFERQREQEKHRLEKERIKDERIKLQQEKEKSRERMFITISKEYLKEEQWLEIFKRVDEIIK